MRAKIKDFLCWLGLHQWGAYVRILGTPTSAYYMKRRLCQNCGLVNEQIRIFKK